VGAANVGQDLGDFEIIAHPIAGRLCASRAPTGIARYGDAGLLEARLRFGGFDIAEIEMENGAGWIWAEFRIRPAKVSEFRRRGVIVQVSPILNE
jgi:hypothetical protein